MKEHLKYPRLMRIHDVAEFCGLRPTQIYEHAKKGDFPKPIKLTESGRAVAWDEDELIAWRNARLTAREA